MSDTPPQNPVKKGETDGKSKPTNSSGKKCGIFTILLIIANVIAFLIWYFQPEAIIGSSQTFRKQIPYVFNANYRQTLEKYIQQPLYDQILLLYGPKGVGKTRGIYTMTKNLTKSGYFPIIFDFVQMSKYMSDRDFLSFLQVTLFKSVAKMQASNLKSSTMTALLPMLQNIASVHKPGKIYINATLSDSTLNGIADSFLQIISTAAESPSVCVKSFFEALSSIQTVVKPLLIIIAPERLFETESPVPRKFAETLWESLREAAAESWAVPAIIEVSDQTALFDLRLDLSKGRFIMSHVGEFTFSESKILVKSRAFSSSDLDTVLDNAGGHGDSIAAIHAFIRDEGSLQAGIDDVASRSLMAFSAAVRAAPNEKKARKFVCALAKAGDTAFESDPDTALFMLRKRVVSLSNTSRIVPACNFVRKATKKLCPTI